MPMHKDKILQLAKVRPLGAALNAWLTKLIWRTVEMPRGVLKTFAAECRVSGAGRTTASVLHATRLRRRSSMHTGTAATKSVTCVRFGSSASTPAPNSMG